MSLILDALNRSRQDVDEVPGLATQHYSEQEEATKRRSYLPWVGLLAALLVIAWLLLDRGPAGDVSPVAAVSAPAAAPAASSPPPANVPASPAPTVRAPQPAAVTSSAVQPAVAEAVEPVPPPQPPPPAEKAGQTGNNAVADLYRQSAPSPAAQGAAGEQPIAAAPTRTQAPAQPDAPAAAETSVQKAEEQPIDIEQMVLQAREQMENARLEEHSAPFIADLSQQTKDAIPTIFYERHDYSGNSAQSTVVLNGKKLKAGGSAAAGVKVEEILPDSVVLSHRGTQFRLRALNSWINL